MIKIEVYRRGSKVDDWTLKEITKHLPSLVSELLDTPIRRITGEDFVGKGHLGELTALRRKLREAEMERDILKKAVGIFSKETGNGSNS